jgi:hypothetical protein
VRKKSILQNPLTPEQRAEQLQQVQPEPIVQQPTSAPAIIPHLQTLYGLFFQFYYFLLISHTHAFCGDEEKKIKDFILHTSKEK